MQAAPRRGWPGWWRRPGSRALSSAWSMSSIPFTSPSRSTQRVSSGKPEAAGTCGSGQTERVRGPDAQAVALPGPCGHCARLVDGRGRISGQLLLRGDTSTRSSRAPCGPVVGGTPRRWRGPVGARPSKAARRSPFPPAGADSPSFPVVRSLVNILLSLLPALFKAKWSCWGVFIRVGDLVVLPCCPGPASPAAPGLLPSGCGRGPAGRAGPGTPSCSTRGGVCASAAPGWGRGFESRGACPPRTRVTPQCGPDAARSRRSPAVRRWRRPRDSSVSRGKRHPPVRLPS